MTSFFIKYMTLICVVLIVFLTYAFGVLGVESYLPLVDEGQSVETLTAVVFGITTLGGAITAWHYSERLWWIFTYFMAFATFRELDLHKAFTGDSILKSNFYKNHDFPFIEKAFGVVFILVLVGFVIVLIKNASRWVTYLRAKNHIAWTVFLGLGMIVFAKTLDSSVRLFPFFADDIRALKAPITLIEETFECTAAFVFFYIALFGVLGVFKSHE